MAAMSVFIGLGIGPGLPVLPRTHLGLGLSAAFSVAAIFLTLHAPETPTERAPAASRPFDPDGIMLLLPQVIWCGGAGWVVLASGVVTLRRRHATATRTAPTAWRGASLLRRRDMTVDTASSGDSSL